MMFPGALFQYLRTQVDTLRSERARHASLRRFARVPPRRDDVEVRPARNEDEVLAALRLLHDAYVQRGYQQPQPSGIRLTPYHLLPTTTLVVTVQQDRVIGTVSIIKDSPLGLPSDEVTDLSVLRRLGERVCEVSSIAVDPAQREEKHVVLLLMKYAMNYSMSVCSTRHLMISVNPRHAEWYQAMLLMRRLEPSAVPDYAFAGGAPAVPLLMDLKRVVMRFARAYQGAAAHRNIHQFLFRDKRPECLLPDPRSLHANHGSIGLDILQSLMRRGLCPPQDMSPRLHALLHAAHGGDQQHDAAMARLLGPVRCEVEPLRHDARWGELWALNAKAALQHGTGDTPQGSCRILSARNTVVELGLRRGVEPPLSATLTLLTQRLGTLRVPLVLDRPLLGGRVRYRVQHPSLEWIEFAQAIQWRNRSGETCTPSRSYRPSASPDTGFSMFPPSLLSVYAAED